MIFHLGIDIQCNYKWGHKSSWCSWIVGIKPKVSATIMYIWWNVPVILGWVVYECIYWCCVWLNILLLWLSIYCLCLDIYSKCGWSWASILFGLKSDQVFFYAFIFQKVGSPDPPRAKLCGYSPPFSHGTWTCCSFFLMILLLGVAELLGSVWFHPEVG